MYGLDWDRHRRHIQLEDHSFLFFDGILKISPNLPLCVTNDIGLSSANAGFRERYGLLLRNKNMKSKHIFSFQCSYILSSHFTYLSL